jgi:hypothetical protein
MLVACRLAGLSALETHYAGVRVGAQFGPRLAWSPPPDLICGPQDSGEWAGCGASGPEDPRPKF